MPYASTTDLQKLLPGVDDERAAALLELASDMIDAFITSPIPEESGVDPYPPRVKLACLMLAARIASVDTTGQVVVQEAIPGYSATLSQPTRPEHAFLMPRHIKALLKPWGPSSFGDASLLGEETEQEPGLWVS